MNGNTGSQPHHRGPDDEDDQHTATVRAARIITGRTVYVALQFALMNFQRPQLTSVPSGLMEHISGFEFPSGAQIRWLTSRDMGIGGWVLDLGTERYRYSDGTVAGLPRHRAFEELGHEHGEDDLRTDADWARFYERKAPLTRLLFMDLDHAYRLAVEHGDANRYARRGEICVLRGTGERVMVEDPGHHDRGRYVWIVKCDSQERRTVHLSWLRFED
jgi:hypothetical protein